MTIDEIKEKLNSTKSPDRRRAAKEIGKPVLELLKFGSLSVANGSLHVLGLDQMRPDAGSIKEILLLSRDRHKDHEVGLGDGRLYLAIACANWDINLTSGFLNHAIETANYISRFGKTELDKQLVEVCQNSLKGKFSKAHL